jgi:ribonuclease P protein component
MPSSGERLRGSNRLKRPEDFKAVFSSNNRRSGDRSFLFLARNNGRAWSRLGLAVPKKHIHSAVERNRLKRIIRESFRLKQNKLKGSDIVVLVRNKLDVNKNNIESMLASHWDKVVS